MQTELILYTLARFENESVGNLERGLIKIVVNSGFHAVDSGSQVLDSNPYSLSAEVGFWILIVGFRIPKDEF